MMELPESFEMALADFGKRCGIELAMYEGRCNFTVDGTVEVEMEYIEEAHVVVAWAVVGYAPDDGYAADRAKALLELNAIDAPNGGFSLSLDPETRRFVAHDSRPAELFESADNIAGWVDALVELVKGVRDDFADRFPCSDILPDDGEDEEEEEA